MSLKCYVTSQVAEERRSSLGQLTEEENDMVTYNLNERATAKVRFIFLSYSTRPVDK